MDPEVDDDSDVEVISGDLPYECRLRISLPSERDAQILHNTLSVDPEVRRDKVRRTMEVEGRVMIINFGSDELKFLRVAVSAFLELAALSAETIARFDNMV